mmetsp:Transcript_18625/g.74377  ORF Transcript_18625/g.74377 Transcript_18625/m.74377 type:complete len:221 (+) Transcript_18625:884-1546(+)
MCEERLVVFPQSVPPGYYYSQRAPRYIGRETPLCSGCTCVSVKAPPRREVREGRADVTTTRNVTVFVDTATLSTDHEEESSRERTRGQSEDAKQARALSKALSAASTSVSEMTRGGARRTTLLCVGLARTPRSRSARQRSVASTRSAFNTSARNKPRPRVPSARSGRSSQSRRRPASSCAPLCTAFSSRFSSSRTRKAAVATAHATGFPPKVEPCWPGLI